MTSVKGPEKRVKLIWVIGMGAVAVMVLVNLVFLFLIWMRLRQAGLPGGLGSRLGGLMGARPGLLGAGAGLPEGFGQGVGLGGFQRPGVGSSVMCGGAPCEKLAVFGNATTLR